MKNTQNEYKPGQYKCILGFSVSCALCYQQPKLSEKAQLSGYTLARRFSVHSCT